MDRLHIIGTANTPEINFNPIIGLFVISGRSIPEDADIYYYPVIRYLEAFNNEIIRLNNKDIKIEFIFNLIYYNTLSIRYLNKIVSLINELKKNITVEIKWYYDKYDEYLEEMGEDFNVTYDGLNMELIQIDPKLNKK